MQVEAYKAVCEHERDYWWYRGRRKIVNDAVRRCGRLYEKVLMDLGCGTGYTLTQLDDCYLKVGVEVSSVALSMAYKRDGSQLVCGDLSALPLKSCSADIVLLLDVLEHLDLDREVLIQIRSLCKKGGKIIVDVPAYQFLWSGEDEVSLHKRRYVKSQLKGVVESAGFRVNRIFYWNMFLMPLMWAYIFLNRRFNKQAMKQSNVYRLPGLINFLFERILDFEALLLRRVNLPFGSALICEATAS